MKRNQKIIILSVSFIIIIILSIIGVFFISKIIRGQKLINEINYYFEINNKYPKDLRNPEIDQNDILNIYKKVFPDENINYGNYPQPYYNQFNNERYYLYYMIGWSKINVWEWLFEYDSTIKRWKISYMQY
jgi:predicted PurR-regulated permease PerM